jgi:hypothetical protein
MPLTAENPATAMLVNANREDAFHGGPSASAPRNYPD